MIPISGFKNLKLRKTRTRRQRFANAEFSIAHFIPYKCHWNRDTILTKKDELLRVIKVRGFSFETADDEDVDAKKFSRNGIFKNISGHFSIWFHTVRRKEEAFPDGESDITFSQALNDEWKKHHDGSRSFVNEHYITLVRATENKGLAAIQNWMKKAQYKADKSAWEVDMRDAFDDLSEVTDRVISALGSYDAKLLGIKQTDHGIFSEVTQFLAMVANGGHFQNMTPPAANIDHNIATGRIYFGPRSIEIREANRTKYAGLVSLKEYKPSTNAGMLDSFLQLPFEFIMTQTFQFGNRMAAISKMQLQQRRLEQSQDLAQSQIGEITMALDSAMSGEYGFGYHHLTVLCIEDNLRSLENSLSMAVVELANVGLNGIREKMNMEAAYWAQLPANSDFIVRKSMINTMNLASFVSMHNYPSGVRSGAHWGNAVTVLNTVSGTPFFFNFHVRDVGHTAIIGPTGAGKTVLMNFLCAQAQKFRCRMFFFDKDRGAEIFVRAIGGMHYHIETSKNSGFNPCQLPDRPDNRAFLVELLKALVMTNAEDRISAEDTARIQEAVSGNYKLPYRDRRLSNIAAFFGIAIPGSIANRLEMWYGRGSHAKLFDNDGDMLDFDKARSFCFEMADIMRDKASLGPVLLYLFHRINMSLDGTPTMIVLDEAWALIDNPIFAPKIKDWLKVLRKLNAFVIFATQSVEDASKSQISDTLIQQTATQIFLPNLKATRAYRDIFMLSEREYNLVKNTDPASRYFLIKQDNYAVVAKIALTGMDDFISVLSGRADTVLLLDQIREEVGDNPDDWLPIFYQRIHDIH